MESNKSWDGKNLYKVRDLKEPKFLDKPEPDKLRQEIEPWLTALFQSEHLSLFVGSGLPTSLQCMAGGASCNGMDLKQFSVFNDEINEAARISAKKSGRGEANIEDQIRACNELISGLRVLNSKSDSKFKVKEELNILISDSERVLFELANSVKDNEKLITESEENTVQEYLMYFLLSFSGRSATRERLNLFTTNYDRVIEFGAELAGIRLIDRFVGTINPIFRSSRVEVDMHYNPPGIRGEPRYLEGVVQYSKLHGSLDWCSNSGIIKRYALPYEASEISKHLPDKWSNLLIYPNSQKDKETAEYPYVELFRDMAAAVCRANSTVVVYGYSFGDDHINRILIDMLSIPSTHLVIISFSDQGGRIQKFYDTVGRKTQMSLMIGNHFGDLKTLVDHYLPKAAIDRTTIKMADLLKSRGLTSLKEDDGENKS